MFARVVSICGLALVLAGPAVAVPETKAEETKAEEKKAEATSKKMTPAEARAKGLQRYKGKWVKPEDIQYLKKGLVKSGDTWVTKSDKAKMDKGLVKHGSSWVTKEDLEFIKKGLFKVQGQWVSKEEANKAHSEWDNAWEIESDHYVVRTDRDFDFAADFSQKAETLHVKMSDFFGFEPKFLDPLPIYLFGDLEEYNTFAAQYANGDEGFRSSAMGCFYALSHPDAPTVTYYAYNDDYKYLWTDQWFHHIVPHSYMTEALPNMASTWLINGIASYFELWSNYQPPFKEIKRKLAGKRFVPLADLFELEGLSDNDNQGFNITPESRHITEAAFLIYFMDHHPKYQPKLKEFFAAMKKSANDMKTFSKVIPVKQLEKDFKSYLKNIK